MFLENVHGIYECYDCHYVTRTPDFIPDNSTKETEMQANTKLNSYQKETLKSMKANMPSVTVLNLDNVTTMAYSPCGNTVEFTLSVMAPTEKKFRRKVGEYYALTRFENGQIVIMAVHDFMIMCEQVWDAYPITE
jgi:hypothetical protein